MKRIGKTAHAALRRNSRSRRAQTHNRRVSGRKIERRSGISDMSHSVRAAVAPMPLAKIGRVRWRVCAMLLAATTINYIDRQVLGVLAPFLQEQIGWNEIAVRLHRHRVPGGLCDRPAVRGRDHRPLRHAHRLRDLDRRVESRSDGPFARGRRRELRRSALRPGSRRSGQFPGRDQDRRGMVSATRTRAGGGHLQLGLEHRRDRRTDARAGRRQPLGVAGGLPLHRRAQRDMAGRLAADVPLARATARAVGRRAGTYPQRSRRARTAPALGATPAPSPDLGLRGREVHHRPDLVVLPVLAAEIPAHGVWPDLARTRPAADRDLRARRRRQHRRRLVRRPPDPARLERQPRAQERDGGVRARGRADRLRRTGRQPVARSCADRPRDRGSSGLVGQPVHADLGHVPAPRRRVRRRHRRFRGRGRRHADLDTSRASCCRPRAATCRCS